MSSLILIAYSNLNIGGIPTKIIDIVNLMATERPDASVLILLQKGGINDQRILITNPNAYVLDLPFSPKWGRRIAYVFWVWWHIVSNRPQAILTFVSPYAIPVLLAKKLFFWRTFRVIVSEDHYTQTVIKNMSAPWAQRLGIIHLYPIADDLVVPTIAVKNQLVRLSGINASRITVIKNWTKLADAMLPSYSRTWDIVHIGRLVASKNPLRVVKTMERYVRAYPDARCAIVGEGPEKTIIEAYLHKKRLVNNIFLMPATMDASAYLLRSKLFLFLPENDAEGFPLVLLEAMACGAIVVTLPFRGVVETIPSASVGVVTHSATSVQTLHSALKSRLIRATARSVVRKHHSMHNASLYIDKLVNAYSDRVH